MEAKMGNILCNPKQTQCNELAEYSSLLLIPIKKLVPRGLYFIKTCRKHHA
jgi:hypothetical protein